MHIIAFGDTILDDKLFQNDGYNQLINYIKKADIVTFNLETVISDKKINASDKAICFRASTDGINRFKYDIEKRLICNIANNHVEDYGLEGFKSTLEILNVNSIAHVGEKNKIVYGQDNNVKYAILGACENSTSDEMCTLNLELINTISEVSKEVDICILHIHWGRELSIGVSSNQIKWAHDLIDAGCDIIIGHHPHVLQGIENYKEGLIFYSLGNFQIPINPYEKMSQYSILASIHVDMDKKISYSYSAVYLDKEGIPRLLNDFENEIIDNILNEANYELTNFSKIRYYLNFSRLYIKESLRAWRLRIKKKEKNIYKKIARWIISNIAIKAFIFMCIDIVIGYSRRRNRRIWRNK